MCLFFFVQAEDGIRDRDVTGVQTCALPILAARSSASCPSISRWPSSEFGTSTPSRSEERREGKSVDLGGRRIIKKKNKKKGSKSAGCVGRQVCSMCIYVGEMCW